MRDTFRHRGWKQDHSIHSCARSPRSLAKDFTMDIKRHIVTIVIDNIETAFQPVSDLLHNYAPHILLRVGYPMRDKNVSAIFLVIDLSLDAMGAFSGKLGQIESVNVKSITLKI